MFKPLPLFIGLRYTAAKRKNNFISFISFVSIGGIALGVMTMIVVLSVMNGFQKEVAEQSTEMAFHNQIVSDTGEALPRWEAWLDLPTKIPNVVAAAPFVKSQGLVNADGNMRPVLIFGVDSRYEANVSSVSDAIETLGDVGWEKGDFSLLKEGEFGIILGHSLAREFAVGVGDYVSLVTSDINITVVGASPRFKRFKVVGVYEAGLYDFEKGHVFIQLEDAARLAKLPHGSVTGIRLKLEDPMKAYNTALKVQEYIGYEGGLSVYTWVDQFRAIYKMIEIEKITMFIIMSLIIAVAVFNVVSMLVMVVTEKRSEIAILRTLGMRPRHILYIFMVQGTFIGFFGAMIGIGLGILIAANVQAIVRFVENILGKTLFEPGVYPVSEIPSIILFNDIAFVAGIAFVLASLATLYPAWRAARTQPAEALRYE